VFAMRTLTRILGVQRNTMTLTRIFGVYTDTDKDIGCSLAFVITACLVVVACAEILLLLRPVHAQFLRVFCTPRGEFSTLHSVILFGAGQAPQRLSAATSGVCTCLLRSLCIRAF